MSIHRRLTSLRRTSSTMISLGVMNLAAAPPALADVGTLALASWINVTDSQGVPVGAYGLSLDNGSLTNPTAGATSLITHWLYGIFQTIIGLALWLVDNVLSFEWLDVLARPLNDLGPKLTAVALHPYLIVAIGTIAAVIIALNMVRGRVSKAGAQIGTATVLALLAVTLANKPLAELIGSGGLWRRAATSACSWPQPCPRTIKPPPAPTWCTVCRPIWPTTSPAPPPWCGTSAPTSTDRPTTAATYGRPPSRRATSIKSKTRSPPAPTERRCTPTPSTPPANT